MGKVTYKQPSKIMNRMVIKPTIETRPSLGMTEVKGEIYYLNPNIIRPYKNQARKNISEESLFNLVASIESNGIIQPLQVIPSLDYKDSYEVVSGERRLRAAIKIGLDKVPCMVLDREKDANEIALIENIQREDLHPIELAEAITTLLKDQQHGSQSELASRIGVSKQQISHLVAIARMPEDVKQHLLKNKELKINTIKSIAYIHDETELRNKVFKSTNPQQIFKSFLRISFNGDTFKLDKTKTYKLTVDQKETLKEKLSDFIKKLEL